MQGQQQGQPKGHGRLSACGMYATQGAAQQTINVLKQDGYNMSDISVLIRKKEGPHNFVHGQKTRIRDGAIFGAIVGFFILGLIALGISFYSMSSMPSTNGIPGQEQLSWRLLLLDTVIGLSLGAMVGAACGALSGSGIPQLVNQRYGFYLKEGGILLAVHVNSKEENKKVTELLKRTGAQDISELYDAELWELAIVT